MSELNLTRDQYLELEKLATGAFAPLTGFMVEDEFHSVVGDMRLLSGEVFPLPVVLDVDADTAARLAGGPSVSLTFGGQAVGEIAVDSLYSCDKDDVARLVFGTADTDHPGVARFMAGGDHFIGGTVKLTNPAKLDISEYALTPEQTVRMFAERGWKTIVGFQTRNVPHRAHEYLQRTALEQVDGLFIQPLVGRKKAGDYTPQSIMAGYRKLMADFYPRDRVVLGILSTSMRYAGPREAVFHALIRRNHGCTHFIVGRDHAGVGDYYGKYAAHELIGRFDGELGIAVMRLHGPFHCRVCDGIVTEHTCAHYRTRPAAITEISGTEIRRILNSGLTPERHIIRPEIVDAVKNVPLFVTGDEE